jgi:hypothetical protein
LPAFLARFRVRICKTSLEILLEHGKHLRRALKCLFIRVVLQNQPKVVGEFCMHPSILARLHFLCESLDDSAIDSKNAYLGAKTFVRIVEIVWFAISASTLVPLCRSLIRLSPFCKNL